MTNAPRISFKNLKGSGVAFRFVFMGVHMVVENHAEVIEDHAASNKLPCVCFGVFNPYEFYKASKII